MKISRLLKEAPSCMDGVEITAVTSDSRAVVNGTLFFCISGSKFDGHDYAQAAADAGAAAIVCERDLGLDNQIIVPDSREAYALAAAEWFDNPAKKMRLVGITGTNGKTSVTYLLRDILRSCGHTVGLMGTVENLIGYRSLPSKNTTPGPYELHELLNSMYNSGCDCAIMEVSSHALHQKRVFGLHFDVGVFMNLTQDHLDYHGTMAEYLSCKKQLFSMCDVGVFNIDDSYASDIMEGAPCEKVTYSTADETAGFVAKNIIASASGVNFELLGDDIIGRIRFNTPGKFSVYNAMAASVAALKLGVPILDICGAFKEMPGVKGRAEVVPTNTEYTVVIDYAHTPDGLYNICSTLSEVKTGKLITLFGCGGDRDRTKRPLMAKMAAEHSDFVVVTSDNPRTEPTMQIINDILPGFEGYDIPKEVIENRREAIEYALSIAREGDIVLLAGKGHETYQILGVQTIHFDEREIVAECLK